MSQQKNATLLKRFEHEMLDGYLAGLDPASPEPREETSASYRHGFNNARDDLHHAPRATAEWIRKEAVRCLVLDTKLALFGIPAGTK